MTWHDVLISAVQKLMEAGPVAIVLLGVILTAGLTARRVFLKIIWPWLTETAHRALEEAKLSREQRSLELAADAQDKAKLHESFKFAVTAAADSARDTARMLSEKIGEKIDGQRAVIVGHLEAIDGKAAAIQQDVRELRQSVPSGRRVVGRHEGPRTVREGAQAHGAIRQGERETLGSAGL